MGNALFVRTVIAWRMPLAAEVPESWRGRWPERWYGAQVEQGRVLGIPSWSWAWLRRTQGDYLERCFVRATWRGRPYLRAVACPVETPEQAAARRPLAVADYRPPVVVEEDPRPIVRRCGCGRGGRV